MDKVDSSGPYSSDEEFGLLDEEFNGLEEKFGYLRGAYLTIIREYEECEQFRAAPAAREIRKVLLRLIEDLEDRLESMTREVQHLGSESATNEAVVAAVNSRQWESKPSAGPIRKLRTVRMGYLEDYQDVLEEMTGRIQNLQSECARDQVEAAASSSSQEKRKPTNLESTTREYQEKHIFTSTQSPQHVSETSSC